MGNPTIDSASRAYSNAFPTPKNAEGMKKKTVNKVNANPRPEAPNDAGLIRENNRPQLPPLANPKPVIHEKPWEIGGGYDTDPAAPTALLSAFDSSKKLSENDEIGMRMDEAKLEIIRTFGCAKMTEEIKEAPNLRGVTEDQIKAVLAGLLQGTVDRLALLYCRSNSAQDLIDQVKKDLKNIEKHRQLVAAAVEILTAASKTTLRALKSCDYLYQVAMRPQKINLDDADTLIRVSVKHLLEITKNNKALKLEGNDDNLVTEYLNKANIVAGASKDLVDKCKEIQERMGRWQVQFQKALDAKPGLEQQKQIQYDKQLFLNLYKEVVGDNDGQKVYEAFSYVEKNRKKVCQILAEKLLEAHARNRGMENVDHLAYEEERLIPPEHNERNRDDGLSLKLAQHLEAAVIEDNRQRFIRAMKYQVDSIFSQGGSCQVDLALAASIAFGIPYLVKARLGFAGNYSYKVNIEQPLGRVKTFKEFGLGVTVTGEAGSKNFLGLGGDLKVNLKGGYTHQGVVFYHTATEFWENFHDSISDTITKWLYGRTGSVGDRLKASDKALNQEPKYKDSTTLRYQVRADNEKLCNMLKEKGYLGESAQLERVVTHKTPLFVFDNWYVKPETELQMTAGPLAAVQTGVKVGVKREMDHGQNFESRVKFLLCPRNETRLKEYINIEKDYLAGRSQVQDRQGAQDRIAAQNQRRVQNQQAQELENILNAFNTPLDQRETVSRIRELSESKAALVKQYLEYIDKNDEDRRTERRGILGDRNRLILKAKDDSTDADYLRFLMTKYAAMSALLRNKVRGYEKAYPRANAVIGGELRDYMMIEASRDRAFADMLSNPGIFISDKDTKELYHVTHIKQTSYAISVSANVGPIELSVDYAIPETLRIGHPAPDEVEKDYLHYPMYANNLSVNIKIDPTKLAANGLTVEGFIGQFAANNISALVSYLTDKFSRRNAIKKGVFKDADVDKRLEEEFSKALKLQLLHTVVPSLTTQLANGLGVSLTNKRMLNFFWKFVSIPDGKRNGSDSLRLMEHKVGEIIQTGIGFSSGEAGPLADWGPVQGEVSASRSAMHFKKWTINTKSFAASIMQLDHSDNVLETEGWRDHCKRFTPEICQMMYDLGDDTLEDNPLRREYKRFRNIMLEDDRNKSNKFDGVEYATLLEKARLFYAAVNRFKRFKRNFDDIKVFLGELPRELTDYATELYSHVVGDYTIWNWDKDYDLNSVIGANCDRFRALSRGARKIESRDPKWKKYEYYFTWSEEKRKLLCVPKRKVNWKDPSKKSNLFWSAKSEKLEPEEAAERNQAVRRMFLMAVLNELGEDVDSAYSKDLQEQLQVLGTRGYNGKPKVQAGINLADPAFQPLSAYEVKQILEDVDRRRGLFNKQIELGPITDDAAREKVNPHQATGMAERYSVRTQIDDFVKQNPLLPGYQERKIEYVEAMNKIVAKLCPKPRVVKVKGYAMNFEILDNAQGRKYRDDTFVFSPGSNKVVGNLSVDALNTSYDGVGLPLGESNNSNEINGMNEGGHLA